MNDNKKADPGSAAQSPCEQQDGQVPTNTEGDQPRPSTEVEERERPDRTGGTSVLGEG